MVKYFVYNQDNGFIAVSTIIDETTDALKDINPNGVYMTAMEMEDLDNDFFRAIQLKDGKLETNMDKAREITKERLRSEREKALKALDVLYQRSLETGKDLKEIETEKQRLRDITQEVDKITTLKELKALEAKTELEFSKLKDLDYSTDEYIMSLQKENEQLQNNIDTLNNQLSNLTNEMTILVSKLKKKYLI